MGLVEPVVVLIRGINVGGRGRLPMADLRALATDLGYGDVATYVQSGNLVCTTDRSADDVADAVRAALDAAMDVSPDVMVRTGAELRGIVERNPYAEHTDDPTRVHVAFMPGRVSAQVPDVDLVALAPDECVAIGRELYLHLPNGLGRSKLAEVVAGPKGPRPTVRNWRTVTALVALADERA